MNNFSKLSEQKRVNDRSEKNDTRNKVERLPLNPVRELCENRRNLYVLVAIDRRWKVSSRHPAAVAAGVVRPEDNPRLRGYGKSGRSEKYDTIEQYAEDLADLCNQLNIQKVIIIGHSMGGMVAVEFAAKYPSLSTAAVLISSGVLFPRAALADESKCS